MVTFILSSLAAVFFLWSGQRFLSDRLKEKGRIKGAPAKGFLESFLSNYHDAESSRRKEDEMTSYLMQGTLLFVWLFVSALSWGLLEPANALGVTLGLLLLTLGAPRIFRARKEQQFSSLISSHLPISGFLLLVAADKSKNLIPSIATLSQSLREARVEPALYRGVKRVERRLRYGMQPQMALERFAKEIDKEAAFKFSEAVVSSFNNLEGQSSEEGMANLKLFASESEAVFNTEEELKSKICFIISGFLLLAVMLASFVSPFF